MGEAKRRSSREERAAAAKRRDGIRRTRPEAQARIAPGNRFSARSRDETPQDPPPAICEMVRSVDHASTTHTRSTSLHA